MAVRPPLNALHVFCTVVREGSFRQAAQVLCVTPGAVSRQVQALEAHLAQVLFDRSAGGLALLTPAGRRLHERVADKMAAIAAALEGGTARRQASILVDTSVTLAMHWLIPQLRFFTERYPRTHVQVRTVEGDIDPAAPVDVFIRRETAELRGLPSRVFMTERSVLVGSPSLMPQPRPRGAGDLRWLSRVARIGARSRTDLWPRWCGAHGLDAKALEPTLEFDNTVLAIQAAAQGLGACVVPEAFVAAMLDSGTLRPLHAARIDTGSYSFAVGRRRDAARIGTFTDWLCEIAAG
ncbi:LysR substrate-binding domain-containing protein [Azohydromonas caseinilytica]|uniref:LysR family transcriptional regulator n=1 Tax=Azohydromonas caseinilytica TaxID=2728836 RepID=A0A848FD61_9BURK|nr:LysR substrate-binding domain-containing protein [Azohydromonas caseinilytica]NML16080.1 LysR family transcriptional regulator [Azohydromonas caseinilytica]